MESRRRRIRRCTSNPRTLTKGCIRSLMIFWKDDNPGTYITSHNAPLLLPFDIPGRPQSNQRAPMAEKANNTLRARRGIRRPICSTCQTLKIRCEYRNLEDDCEQCKRKGSRCRYFQSAAPDTVEVILEADIQPGRRPLTRRLALKILSNCTPYSALEAATSDAECEQVIKTLKSEWLTIFRWVVPALGTMDIALLVIDPQSVFTIDLVSRRAIAASSAATLLGFFSDLWFLGRYYSLQPKMFMTQTKDVYGSYAFFSLSARLPSLAVLISILALSVFIGRVAYQVLPAFVIVLGVVFAVVMILQYIVRGSEVFYCSIAQALSTVGGWMQHLRNKARNAVRNESDLPTNGIPAESNGR
ncbi:hypothetical protein MVEN_01150600 [Mycena venus]|uniref:Zn(2)-C6 fungal-type domain-containing protein n=1 Tax=Mycena venus TaxID=2733690 RepID=A0A8H6Y4S2_9AGAR|nr:hypothetical protein MVEN_01150600 [Mycena venus]